MSVAITPENLPVIAAKLGVEESTLAAVLSASQAASMPMPPGVDDASVHMVARFCEYQSTFYTPTHTALSNMQQGSDLLVPVSTDYTLSDIANGAVVGAQSALFGQ